MAHTAKKPSFFPLIWIGLVGVAVAVLVSLWFNHAHQSYPLGDSNKLEYIGKVDYGCPLLCDSAPSATYYYATDMSADEVIRYFSAAKLDHSPRTSDGVTDFNLTSFTTGQDIAIDYYNTKDILLKKYPLKDVPARHILRIPSFDYAAAKESL